LSRGAAPILIVVSGPSGTGKSTLITCVMEGLKGLRISVSHTTRPRRGEEVEGVNYHFVSPPQFQKMIERDELLEWAEVYGYQYGTSRAEWENAVRDGYDLITDLDVVGAATVRRKIADAVTVFILPPTFAELKKRLRGRRTDDEAVMRRRLNHAIEEIRHYREYDYVLVNDRLEECVKELKGVIRANRARISRADAVAQSILKSFEEQQ
jgi:guanylate kinase